MANKQSPNIIAAAFEKMTAGASKEMQRKQLIAASKNDSFAVEMRNIFYHVMNTQLEAGDTPEDAFKAAHAAATTLRERFEKTYRTQFGPYAKSGKKKTPLYKLARYGHQLMQAGYTVKDLQDVKITIFLANADLVKSDLPESDV